MLDKHCGEEFFPNSQSKPPLARFKVISSFPSTCYLAEETNLHLSELLGETEISTASEEWRPSQNTQEVPTFQ